MRRLACHSLLLAAIAWNCAAFSDAEPFQRAAPPKIPPVPLSAAPLEADSKPDALTETADPVMDEIGRAWENELAGEQADTTAEGATTTQDTGDDDGDGSFFSAFLQAAMALCITLALFLLLLAALKRWGRRTPLLAGHDLGTIMGRIALSPQASLHFVRVNDEVLLIGVTAQSVTLIRSIDAEVFEGESEAPTPAKAPVDGAEPVDFLAQLRASQSSMSAIAGSKGMDEELDNLKGDLQRLKQYFQESSRAPE